MRFLLARNSFYESEESVLAVREQFSSLTKAETLSSSRLSWLFYVLRAENSAMIVGTVVLTADEWSMVEGSRFCLEVMGLVFLITEFL